MKRYFVTDIHRASDAGVMERDLVDYARKIYLNVLVNEDRIDHIVEHILKHQNVILALKPRRSRCLVSSGINDFVAGHAYITIGSSQMNLTLVQGEVM